MFPGLSTFGKHGQETLFRGFSTFRKHGQETMFSGLTHRHLPIRMCFLFHRRCQWGRNEGKFTEGKFTKRKYTKWKYRVRRWQWRRKDVNRFGDEIFHRGNVTDYYVPLPILCVLEILIKTVLSEVIRLFQSYSYDDLWHWFQGAEFSIWPSIYTNWKKLLRVLATKFKCV
jgi:hypothetical protein